MSTARDLKSEVAVSALNPDKSRELRIASVIEQQASILDKVMQGRVLESFTAIELKKIGLTYNEKSDYQNAKKAFTLALAKLAEEEYKAEEATIIKANCYYGLANVARELGDSKEAIRLFIQAATECKEPPVSMEAYQTQYDIQRNLGIAYLQVKEYEKAGPCFDKATELAKAMGKELLVPAVIAYYGLAVGLSGNYQAGTENIMEARSLFPVETREQSMDYASNFSHMGRVLQAAGEYAKAIDEFNEALRLRLKIIGPRIGSVYYHSRVGDVHAALGQCYAALAEKYSAQAEIFVTQAKRRSEKARSYYDRAGTFLNRALVNYQTVNNKNKLEETQAQLAALHTTNSWKKYVHYGVVGALAAVSVGLFAYKLVKGEPAQPEDNLLKTVMGLKK